MRSNRLQAVEPIHGDSTGRLELHDEHGLRAGSGGVLHLDRVMDFQDELDADSGA